MKRISLLLLIAACGPGGTTTDPTQLCPANGEPTGRTAPKALVTRGQMIALAVAPNAIVYLDRVGGDSAASTKSGVLHKMNLDGTGDVELYAPDTSTFRKNLFDVAIKGDTIYVTEQEQGLNLVTRMLRFPLSSTGATVPMMTELSGSFVFFVNGGNVGSENALYVKVANDGSTIGEIGKYSTDDFVLTSLLGPSIISVPIVLGDSIYYLTRDSLKDDATKSRFTKAPKTPRATGTTIPNVFCRGSMFVSSDAVYCSGYSSDGTGSPSGGDITRTTLEGANPTPFATYDDVFNGDTNVGAVVGNELILVAGIGASKSAIVAADEATGAARALTCTVRTPKIKTGDGRPMMVASSDTIYWIADGEKTTDPSILYTTPVR